MKAVVKFILFLFWGAVVPMCCGLLPAGFMPKEKRRLHLVAMGGFLSSFTICELCGLPVIFLTSMGDFQLLLYLYLGVSAVWIVLGIWRCAKTGGLQQPLWIQAIRHEINIGKTRRSHHNTSRMPSRKPENFNTGRDEREKREKSSEKIHLPEQTAVRHTRFLLPDEIFFWSVFLCLLIFQLVMAYRMASYDGDDAYYVAQSVQTWQTGTMYHYVPYTGVTTTLDARHAMALMPMWITIIARMCHTHPTIVTHSMIPLIFIPLCDTCFYSLMAALLYDKVNKNHTRKMLPASLCILAVFQIFGNVSIYVPESFVMLRTWQGKTVFAAIIIPCVYTMLLYLAHRLTARESVKGVLFMIFLINAASGLCTAMAPFLTAALLLFGGIFVSIAVRNGKGFLYLLPTCIPNLIYALILLKIMMPYLLS